MTGRQDGITLRITGERLPGLRWAEHSRVHVGVQRGREPVGLVPADAERAEFAVPVRPVTADDGTPDWRGP